MKRVEADDIYGTPAERSEAILPLLDANNQPRCACCSGDGPFSKSKIKPDTTEKLVAGLIFHRNRRDPISIAQILQDLPHHSERTIKDVVHQLRLTHRCPIGASRRAPVGYYWIRDAEDQILAAVPYRAQILEMLKVLRILDSPERYAGFVGQLQLEAEKGD